MNATHPIIALCASHVDTGDRLAALHRMLDSVCAQTCPIDLYLSVSGTDFVSESWLSMHYGSVHVRHRGARRLSQFQHYKLLVDELSHRTDTKRTWCIFTDDDDVWHEIRVESYAVAIDDATRRGRYAPVACIGGRMHNGQMVEMVIEYFEFAATLHEFVRFFEIATPEMLALRGCDLLWRNAMRLARCSFFRATVPWLYKQRTPRERMDELDTYIGAAKDAWDAYQSFSTWAGVLRGGS